MQHEDTCTETQDVVVDYDHSGKLTHNMTTKHIQQYAIPVSIIIAGLIIAGAILLTGRTSNGTPKRTQNASPTAGVVSPDLQIRDEDHIIGNPDADLVMIVWSDLECPFCKRHHTTIKQIASEFGDKIAIVYRHWALPFHTYAEKEAEATECAAKIGGEEMFWKYTDKLFEITEGNNSLKREDLDRIADMVGLDKQKLGACLDSGEMAVRIQADKANGDMAGVQGTPHNILYNVKTGRQRPVNGAQPIDAFRAAITQLSQQ
jgi:protein-disulfide isomerase